MIILVDGDRRFIVVAAQGSDKKILEVGDEIADAAWANEPWFEPEQIMEMSPEANGIDGSGHMWSPDVTCQ